MCYNLLFSLLLLYLFLLFLCPFPTYHAHMHSCCLLLIQFQPISLLVAIETAMLNGSPMNFHYDIFKVAVGTMKTAPQKTGFENRMVPVTKTLCSTSLMPECKHPHVHREDEYHKALNVLFRHLYCMFKIFLFSISSV